VAEGRSLFRKESDSDGECVGGQRGLASLDQTDERLYVFRVAERLGIGQQHRSKHRKIVMLAEEIGESIGDVPVRSNDVRPD
jgi:hypothetical protein